MTVTINSFPDIIAAFFALFLYGTNALPFLVFIPCIIFIAIGIVVGKFANRKTKILIFGFLFYTVLIGFIAESLNGFIISFVAIYALISFAITLAVYSFVKWIVKNIKQKRQKPTV